jgi:light-regulated signal transduction histidine kinase (bacteriophytochrome)
MIKEEAYISVDSKSIEEQVGEATAGLEQLKKDLVQVSYKLKSSQEEFEQFVYVASHDLQAPLRVVSGYLQLLEKKSGERLDPQSKEFMSSAKDGLKKMDDLISALLTYSLVDKKKRMLADIDTAIACEQAVANLHNAIKEHQAVIILGRLPIINADANHIVQLFQYLILHAIKFRRTLALQVDISATLSDQKWLFTVKNNGLGIDPQHQDKIFDIMGGSSSLYPDLGFGLAICRKIVEMYGGRIWVKSEFGQGSAFFFTIPVVTLS